MDQYLFITLGYIAHEKGSLIEEGKSIQQMLKAKRERERGEVDTRESS